MSDWMALAKKLSPSLKRGDIDKCLDGSEKALLELPETGFHSVVRMNFTNDPAEVAAYFDRLIDQTRKKFEPAALYTETNGFDINPDRWYFDGFAYDKLGDKKDFSWLGEWKSSLDDNLTLTGMEDLQAIYDSDAIEEDEEASGFCSLVVVIKFQMLIRRSAPLIKNLRIPLLATSHDYDFIYEFKPQGNA